MRIVTWFAFLLAPIACLAQEGSPGPRSEDAVKKAPVASGMPLSAEFPFVRVTTSSSFVHDYGVEVRVGRVSVGGTTCPAQDVLACVVKHWNGWNAKGDRNDAAILATAGNFVQAWDRLFEWPAVTSADAPVALAQALQFRESRLVREVGKKDAANFRLQYHAPRQEIVDVRGERVVVVTRFIRTNISQRGQHWEYRVSAFRVKDGSEYEVLGNQLLPQPAALRERP